MALVVPEHKDSLRARLAASQTALADLITRAQAAKAAASSAETATLADLILDLARETRQALSLLREAVRRKVE